MEESRYLKESVGSVLAQGVAQVVKVRPSDPIEYLGLWLLHQTQLRDNKEKREAKCRIVDNERISYDIENSKRRNEAASTIQKEMRNALEKRREQQKLRLEEQRAVLREEQELLKKAQTSKDDQPAVDRAEEDDEIDESVLKAEVNVRHQRSVYSVYQEFMKKIRIDSVKKFLGSPDLVIHKLIKCILLLIGIRPKLLNNWEQIKKQVKSPKWFLRSLQAYDPEAIPQPKNKFTAIHRILRAPALSPDQIIQVDTSAYILIQSLHNALSLHQLVVQERKAKNQTDEEDDEDDEDFNIPDELETLVGEELPQVSQEEVDHEEKPEDDENTSVNHEL